MRRLLRPGLGALLLLLAAAVSPRPGSAADATHPLDPEATPGVLPVDDPFAGHVPMLDREAPAPSFVTAPAADAADRAAADTGAMRAEPAAGHAGHAGGMVHGARHATAPTE